jgi:hypothetical protein
MRLFEIEEAHDIIKHINGILLMFSATPKTSKLLMEYLESLILELQDQDLIDEAQEQSDQEINLDDQVNFLKSLLNTLQERELPKVIVDKNSN